MDRHYLWNLSSWWAMWHISNASNLPVFMFPLNHNSIYTRLRVNWHVLFLYIFHILCHMTLNQYTHGTTHIDTLHKETLHEHNGQQHPSSREEEPKSTITITTCFKIWGIRCLSAPTSYWSQHWTKQCTAQHDVHISLHVRCTKQLCGEVSEDW